MNPDQALHLNVLSSLGRWKRDFEHDVENKLNIWHIYSPAWIDLRNHHWNNYERLVSRQVRAQVPRLYWQDDVETNRTESLAWQKRTFKPMPDHLWNICPLSVHFDRYLSHDSQDRAYGWRSALANWNRLRDFLKGLENTRSQVSAFMKSLSASQMSSLQVLKEWWSSSYCDPQLVAAARSYMESRAGQRTSFPFTPQNVSDSLPSLISMSLYHSQCFRLFLREFHPQVWEPFTAYLSLQMLQNDRYHAAIEAGIQRLAYAALNPKDVSVPNHTPYPAPILNEYSWNKPDPSAPGPHYLWDNRRHRTIVTGTLEQCPSYVCISHTWGRWRKSSSVRIPGVDWPVPENTRYDIRTLPDQLGHVQSDFVWFDLFCIPQDGSPIADAEIANQAAIFKGAAGSIAWINDVESWDVVRNDLDWLGLKYLKTTTTSDAQPIDQSLVKVARFLDASPQVELVRTVLTKAKWRSTPVDEPKPWFSSLWTLQECVLRQDIKLYSREWEALTDRCGAAVDLRMLMMFISRTTNVACLESRIQTPLTNPNKYRSDIMALDERRRLVTTWSPPNGVRDLQDLARFTRLADILGSLSPVTVFTNANIRECTGDRAAAIMSAVGVTDWYLPWRLSSRGGGGRDCRQSSQQEEDQKLPLVLGIYPLAFLREALRKFGAVFFETSSSKDIMRLSTLDLVLRRREPVGSLLPLSRETDWAHNVAVANMQTKIDVRDHEAVSRWAIRADGAVDIPVAGIVAASDDDDQSTSEEIPAMIDWLEADMGWNIGDGAVEVPDLVAKLREIARGQCVYAVALYEDCGRQFGVLLQSPRANFLMRRRHLIKIGRYILKGVEMPPSRDVDWVVL